MYNTICRFNPFLNVKDKKEGTIQELNRTKAQLLQQFGGGELIQKGMRKKVAK
jgi:hypothetical protein